MSRSALVGRTKFEPLEQLVRKCKGWLVADYSAQVQRYGIDPDGSTTPADQLGGSEQQRAEAMRLQAWLSHIAETETGATAADRASGARERLIRESAFTMLNRLLALRLCEEREVFGSVKMVQEGTTSNGFRLFERLLGGGLNDPFARYRCYLDRVADDLAEELGTLFDRSHPAAILFPTSATLDSLLGELTSDVYSALWSEDEAIGWAFQYFNSREEVDKLRKHSRPRTAREMAVRNQFFTPRYVVEFLVDNTLGRLWYEMRRGDTVLATSCSMMVWRPPEQMLWLDEGQDAPEDLDESVDAIRYVAPKDPRDLRVLDPAVGSGHFLLYAYDVLELIYEEAWSVADQPASELTGRPLREDYADWEMLRRDIPRLVLESNLWGVDIDVRAAQVASFALWLRAHKGWVDRGVRAAERPRLERFNIVCAEPMPGESAQLEQFCGQLRPPALAELVRATFEAMTLAGEAGTLLPIEEMLQGAIQSARERWSLPGKQTSFLVGETAVGVDPRTLPVESFWETAEEQTLEALRRFAAEATGLQEQLFARDVERGFTFVDVSRLTFDVVVMNPPFGRWTTRTTELAKLHYPNSYNDVFAAFTDRFLQKVHVSGRLGVISSRTGFFLGSFRAWRENVLRRTRSLTLFADLGEGVMHNAMVEAAAYVMARGRQVSTVDSFRVIASSDREGALRAAITSTRGGRPASSVFRGRLYELVGADGETFVYWARPILTQRVRSLPAFEHQVGPVKQGLATGDNKRFTRLFHEVDPASLCTCGEPATTNSWVPFIAEGSSSPWYSPVTLCVKWACDGRELRNFRSAGGKLRSRVQNVEFYFRPGLSWTRRAVRLIPYAIPRGCVPSVSRYMAYAAESELPLALALLGANVSSAQIRFRGEKFSFPNFLVDDVRALGVPGVSEDVRGRLTEHVEAESVRKLLFARQREPLHEFVAPPLEAEHWIADPGAFDYSTLLGPTLEHDVANACGLSDDEHQELCRDLQEAVSVVRGGAHADPETADDDAQRRSDWCRAIVSYAVGVAFGRWDVRMAVDPTLAPPPRSLFETLPRCPPGSLLGSDGLPARVGDVASPDRPRKSGSVDTSQAIAGHNSRGSVGEYPVAVIWSGVASVDELDHSAGLSNAVRHVLRVLFAERADEVEEGLCVEIGASDLRSYLSDTAGFFRDHVRVYTVNGRVAPIYWPIGTEDGSWIAWIYYPALSDRTLFDLVERHIDPALRRATAELERVQLALETASGSDASQLRDALGVAEVLTSQLDKLRTAVREIADAGYAPDHDDGVAICAAPLADLIPDKFWREKLEPIWTDLQGGKYDWAKLAMVYRPEQVLEACRKDLSIAIAHGREELFEGTPKKRGKRAKSKASSADLFKAKPARRRSNGAVDTDATTVEEHLRGASQAQGKSDIVGVLGLSDARWSKAIRLLVDSGRVIQEGQRRGARYRTP